MNTSLLKKICETPGTSGFENRIRNLIISELDKTKKSYSIDNMGNLTVLIKGKNQTKKVMLGAHMDEIGFIVTHIDENGFLRFHTLGGFDPKTLTSQRVIVHGKKDLIGVMGSKPIHVLTPEEKNKVPKTTDFFIDMGMPKKEVEKFIEIGNPITRERAFIEMGNCFNCKSLDNRISVYILLELIGQLKNPYFDVYAVFTVQEEVGIRGANVATQKIQPDFGFGIDTTIAFDVPGAANHQKITELGKGVGIKIMDASTICDSRMVAFMKQTAEKNKINWQSEILTAGGTDTSGIQRMTPGGSIAGAISIPTRHIHQVIEMVHKEDVENAVLLLKKCLENMGSFNWDYSSQ